MQRRGIITQLPRDPRRQSGLLENAVRDHLQRLLRSPHFDAAARSREFLCFVVDQALAGRDEYLNQTAIAVAVFGRQANFDAVLDPIVRVQAGRLRRSLERYYLLTGDTQTVRIELPKGSYTPVFAANAAHGEAFAKGRSASLAALTTDWPSIAIRLLATSSPEDSGIAARIKDELTTELYRYGDLHVIRARDMDKLDRGQQASVRFELRGALRREADDCLVSTHLMDRTTGEQIWSDEYHTAPHPERWSGSIDSIARVIAARVGSEQGIVARLLAAECTDQPVVARDCSAIQRCYRFFFSREISEFVPTVQAVEQVTVRNPECALAWAYLSRLYQVNYSFELSPLHTPIEKAVACANQGLLLDPTGARTRCICGAALLIMGELELARLELEQALRLNPDSLAYREVISWLLALSGDWERGMALMRQAMDLNPYCMPQVQHGLWADHLRRGEFDKAYIAAVEYRDPTFFWRHLMMASCLGHLGRMDDARTSVEALLQAKPEFPERGRTLIGYYIKPDELRERIFEGLRKAGLVLL